MSEAGIDQVAYPEIILALQADLGTRGDGGALVSPGTGNRRCSVNCDLSSGGETVVRAIRMTDERRVMSVVANTAAGHGVGITVDSTDCGKQRCDNRRTHPGGR